MDNPITPFKEHLAAVRAKAHLLYVDRELPKWEGCDEATIQAVESTIGYELPKSYRAFLAEGGRVCDPFFMGEDFAGSPEAVKTIRKGCSRMLTRRNAAFSLPENAFVFMSHQGYIYDLFYIGEGDDPPIYVLDQRDPSPKWFSGSFSRYLSESVDELLKIDKECRARGTGGLLDN